MDIEKLEELYKSLNSLATTFKGLENVLKQPDALTFAIDVHVSPKVKTLVGEFVYLYENLKAREFCEHLSEIANLGYYDACIRKQIVELEKLCPLGFEALDNGCFDYCGFFYDSCYYINFHQIYHDVVKEIIELSKIFDFYFADVNKFGKPQQIEQETSTYILPNELNTDEALKYFDKAKENGLIDENYKWLKGKQLLACFCHDMSQKLTLDKGGRTAWKPFEKLFGVTKEKLRSNYNDIQKTGQNPSDIALVDSIFQ